MGRAARRQQEKQARRQARQQRAPARTMVSPSAPLPEAARYRGVWWKPRWVQDIVSELRKVTWPTRHETAHLTLVVVVVAVLFGIVLGAADIGFSWVVERTVLR